jgi:hypothetical protein
MNHVINLEPNYNNYQVDLYSDEHKYIFSTTGTCVLNTPNKDKLNFIISFRICLDFSQIRNNHVKIEEVISVDFIKIKIY